MNIESNQLNPICTESASNDVLSKFSTDDLRAELKRRAAQMRAARLATPRCHMCIYWGSVTYWDVQDPLGHSNAVRTPKSSDAPCPFTRIKSGKHPRCMPAYTHACEHFVSDELCK